MGGKPENQDLDIDKIYSGGGNAHVKNVISSQKMNLDALDSFRKNHSPIKNKRNPNMLGQSSIFPEIS